MKKSFLFGVFLAMIGFSTIAGAATPKDLPVKFIRFYAQQVGDIVRIRWTTDSEYNNDFFTVERSKDMNLWEPLETVPGSGISPGAGQYEYFDTEPIGGINYYRIRQTDLNGAYDFSHIEKVEMESLMDEIADVALAPNPLPGLNTSFTALSKSSLTGATVKLLDITGREIPVIAEINDTELTVTPFRKTPGLYFLVIRKGEKTLVEKIKFE